MGDDLHVKKDAIPDFLEYVRYRDSPTKITWPLDTLRPVGDFFSDAKTWIDSVFGGDRDAMLSEAHAIANSILKDALNNPSELGLLRKEDQNQQTGEYILSKYNLMVLILGRFMEKPETAGVIGTAEAKWRELHPDYPKKNSLPLSVIGVFIGKVEVLIEKIDEAAVTATLQKKDSKQTATMK